MRLRKRCIVMMLVSVCLAGTWAGGAQQQSKSAEKVTLRLLTYFNASGTATPVYEEVMKGFQADFPNVTLQHEGMESANARDKLAVEMAAGTPPDVSFMVQSLGREYGQQGLLLDLAPYLAKDAAWKGSYYPSALASFTVNGKIYLVPSHSHFGGLYYNKTVLAKAGITTPATTWPELIDQVKRIRAAGINPFLTGGKDARYAWFISQLLVRTAGVEKMNALYYGSEKTGWDKPENGFIDALKLFKELVDAGAFPKDINGLSRNVARVMFGQDEGAYWYEGTWKVSTFASVSGKEFLDRLGWTTFPMVPGAKGDQNGGVGGPLLGWGVSGKIDGAKRDYAVELVKRFESRESANKLLNVAMQPTGTMPDLSAMSNLHPLLRAILSTYSNIKKVAYPTDVAAVPAVDNAIKKIAIPGLIEGTLTPEQAAKEVNLRALEFFK